jgi:hypothetical protein
MRNCRLQGHGGRWQEQTEDTKRDWRVSADYFLDEAAAFDIEIVDKDR